MTTTTVDEAEAARDAIEAAEVAAIEERDQERIDEALALSPVDVPALDWRSTVGEIAGLLGVVDHGDDAVFAAAVVSRLLKLKEEAMNAKFREAIMSSSPSGSVRRVFDRILEIIGATTPTDGLDKIERFLMERNNMERLRIARDGEMKILREERTKAIDEMASWRKQAAEAITLLRDFRYAMRKRPATKKGKRK